MKKKPKNQHSNYYFNPNTQSNNSSGSNKKVYEDVAALEKEVQVKKKQLNEISNLVDQYRVSRGSQSERCLKSKIFIKT